ncbi:MAG: exodeoxyribonuclease VII small subunit [Bdellovibrionales bacterium]|nr:exodeoxyribonuclease VII small subunit [Bdellovibrionales bacterium]
MSVKKEDQQFEEHFRKLETLSQELQANRVSIDQLVPRMKDALGSIKICKSVLKETRSQLEQIAAEFEELDALATPPE